MQGIVSNEIGVVGEATERRDRVILKREYLVCLRDISASRNTLRSVITDLLRLGVGATYLVRWAIEVGHREPWVRKLISDILREAGICRRKTGAGRETSQEALALLAYARHQHGEKAAKILRAAYRAAQKEQALKKESALPQLTMVGG